MKNILKTKTLLFLALCTISSNLMSAETLVDAFKNAKFSGKLKSFYYSKDFNYNDDSTWANGGNLNMLTDDYYGLKFGANLQTSHIFDSKNNGNLNKLDIQGSNLNEAYLMYTYKNTTFKGGRQDLVSPLSQNSKSDIITDSYEAYALINTDLPNTVLVLGHIAKYMPQYNSTGNIGKYDQIQNVVGVKNAKAYTFILHNESIKNLNINFQLGTSTKFHKLAYFDGTYNFNGNLKSYLSAQMYYTKWDDISKHPAPFLAIQSDQSNSLIGLKFGANIKNIDLSAAVTKTGKTGLVWHGYGDGSYYQYTATSQSKGKLAFEEDTIAYKVSASTSIKNFNTKISYANFNVGAINSDLDEINLSLGYKFNGSFKGLNTSIDYSILNYENNINDNNSLEIKVIYSF